jgi:enolase
MIAPTGVLSFTDAVKAGSEIFHALKIDLKKYGLTTSVGDEGGFAPNLRSPEEGIEMIINAIENAGYSTKNIKICIDVAASELYEEGECGGGMCSLSKYKLSGVGHSLSSEEMVDYLSNLVETYPIISIEDGVAEDDELGWRELTSRLGKKCQLVGDDLFVTNVNRLMGGIRKRLANSILIKPNQIGTLSETLDTILMAQMNNYATIISHRSGETEDTFIADLAVAVNAGLIKTGSLSRTDRICKYNRLLKIEQELGSKAKYMGIRAFKNFEDCSSDM